MPQTARPIADVSTGGWTPTPASPADLYSHLNAPSPDGASYVTAPAGGGAFEVKLGPVFSPRTDTGHAYALRPAAMTALVTLATADDRAHLDNTMACWQTNRSVYAPGEFIFFNLTVRPMCVADRKSPLRRPGPRPDPVSGTTIRTPADAGFVG